MGHLTYCDCKPLVTLFVQVAGPLEILYLELHLNTNTIVDFGKPNDVQTE